MPPGTVAYPAGLDTVTSLFEVGNNLATTVGATVASGDASITVASTTGFPSTGVLTLSNTTGTVREIVYYTGKTATTFTGLSRGQDGTSAQGFASGDNAQMRIVARHVSVLRDAIIQTETKVGTGTATPASGQFLKGTGAGASGWSALTAAELSTALSVGDTQQMVVATTAQQLAISKGTAASPLTTVGALLKVERLSEVGAGSISGDGGEQMSAIMGINVSTAANVGQVVGVYGGGLTNGNNASGGANDNDALGLYGWGRSIGTSTGTGIGGFVIGSRENDTGRACGLEVHVANYGTVAGTYTSNGSSTLKGIWLNCSGNAGSGAGMQISNAFGRQFKVGIGFTSQVVGGLTGGIADTSIRDDSNSTNSIIINGTHGLALGVKTGSGAVAIGHINATDALTNSSALLEVFTSVALNPIFALQGNGTIYVAAKIGNSSGSAVSFVSAASGDGVTGSVAGGTGWAINTSGKNWVIGGAGQPSVLKVEHTGTGRFAAFNATAVAQQTSAPAAATDLATALTLVNFLRTSLLNYGWIA